MEAKRSAKKIWAAGIAGALTAAIALTGTLAWRNMTQRALNEALADKNPGGRIHDDFDGVNKDIYAENFTDPEKGAYVFARVRLLEYMEVGEDAGANRTVTDDSTGEQVTNPDRKVTVTKYISAAGETVEPDINDTSTWYIHKPDTDTETDPFHDYWRWDTGGSTIYMPTFNKNKDSITPEINGTYLGPNKEFDTDDPYEDNVTYTDGQKITADAYYDADGDDIDENYGKYGDQPFDGIPGAGGDRKDPDADPPVEDPDYEVINEEHTAHATLNGLGVITMSDWIADGRPVCNKWVWDEDGWFYWPEPILPQTATGLLLDRLSKGGGTSEKCYYAIEVEGQFVSVDGDWGEPEVKEGDTVTTPATGFYIDHFSDNAKALLEQAIGVEITGENWYLPIDGQINLFRQIKDDEGKLGDPLLAGADRTPGTTDDRDVIFVESGVTVNGTDYGQWFLAPRTTDPYYEPYYRSVGNDGQLGTSDDGRIWLLSGEFPTGELTDKIADKVFVTKPEGTVDIDGSAKIEMEVGTTLAQPFTAEVKLGDESMTGDRGAVYWEVSSAMVGEKLAAGTKITRDTGILTLDPQEKAAELIVTAKCKMDDRVEGTYRVKPFGKLNVKLTLAAEESTSFTSIQAGKTVRLQATLYRGDEVALAQPTSFTWGTPSVATGAATLTADEIDPRIGVLFVDRAAFGGKTVVFTVGWDAARPGTSFTVPITAPDPVNVTVTNLGVDAVEPNSTLTFKAEIDHAEELADPTVTWKAFGTDGKEIVDMFVITPDDANNTVEVRVRGGTFVLSEKTNPVTVRAYTDDPTAGGGSGSATFTVIPPASVEVTPASGNVKYAINFQMTAQVKGAGGNNYGSNQVTWKVTDTSDNPIDGVTISDTGALRVGKLIPNGTELKVTATSKVSSNVSGTAIATLSDYDVTIDNVSFLILKEDLYGDRALILTKDCIATSNFAEEMQRHWGIMEKLFKVYFNPFLNSHPTLNSAAIQTKTYTRVPFDGSTFVSAGGVNSNDKIFLLSAGDIFGTAGKGTITNLTDKDYTAGERLVDPSGKKWIAKYNGSAVGWWTRSNAGSEGETYVTATGTEDAKNRSSSVFGVRPALWVDTTILTF